jgi:hypothetical protein
MTCEHCGAPGVACGVCGRVPVTDGAAVQDALAAEVKRLRRELADARESVADLESCLRRAESAAGCRPGDGSDQPSLFDVSSPGLF